jgi:hypothetical protein
VGPVKVRRKCLGTGKERLSCEFGSAKVDLTPYRDAADVLSRGGR